MKRARGTGFCARATLGPLVALAAACAERSASKPLDQHLPPGIAAVVGNERVSVGSVERIARREQISLPEARNRAVDDALYATAARADPALADRVSVAERGVLARAVLEHLRDEARALGPPSDDEVRALTAQRWPELERPASVRTTHAVVLVKTPADDASARSLAMALAAALKGVKNGDELVSRAQAFPAHGLEIRAEHLPPVTPDGRMWDPDEHPPRPVGGTLDPDFTHAAQALAMPGDLSGVVKSAFGYHVILLDERYPELVVPFEQRRVELADEVYAQRAKRELDGLLGSIRASTPVSSERAVEALTALVPVLP
jgi:hypothetical protein